MLNCDTPRKNGLVQITALKKIDNLLLHTNFKDWELPQTMNTLIRVLHINNKNVAWYSDKEYAHMIANTDLGMQVTFCEGFNYVMAEHFFQGIPVLTSGANPIIEDNKMIHNYLVVKDIASTDEIISKIKVLQKDSKLRNDLGKECKKQLTVYSDKTNKKCIEILKDII